MLWEHLPLISALFIVSLAVMDKDVKMEPPLGNSPNYL